MLIVDTAVNTFGFVIIVTIVWGLVISRWIIAGILLLLGRGIWWLGKAIVTLLSPLFKGISKGTSKGTNLVANMLMGNE